jgi:hypothetical protein
MWMPDGEGGAVTDELLTSARSQRKKLGSQSSCGHNPNELRTTPHYAPLPNVPLGIEPLKMALGETLGTYTAAKTETKRWEQFQK